MLRPLAGRPRPAIFTGRGDRKQCFTGQLTLSHNAYHGVRAIEFSPASPSVMYLGLVSEQLH